MKHRALVVGTAAIVVALVACGGGSGGGSAGDGPPGTGDDGGGAGDDGGGGGPSGEAGGPPACSATGFAQQATPFALPGGYDGFGSLGAGSDACQGGNGQAFNYPGFATTDVTGDGKPDIVVFSACTDASVGKTHWLVYPGTGSGFASSAVDFALPGGYDSFGGLASAGADCQDPYGKPVNYPGYTTTDLTGDGKPDIVVHDACKDATVGKTNWLVYAGTGSGFASAPITFALPGGYDAFSSLASSGADCQDPYGKPANYPGFATVDLTGDRRPDIVVYGACKDASVGKTSWLVYPGNGGGFDSTPITFALPGGYDGFGSLASNGAGCQDGYGKPVNYPGFTTSDLTGDGKPDLVVYAACKDASVGKADWLVYPSDGHGFASTAVPFALPGGYDGFGALARASDACQDGYGKAVNYPGFATVDLTGDRKPDLVVYAACKDASVGKTNWLVYPNDGAGFAPAAATFALPAGYDAFTSLASASDACQDGSGKALNYPGFTTTDLTGDGKPDVVVYSACKDASVGKTQWLVYPGVCAN